MAKTAHKKQPTQSTCPQKVLTDLANDIEEIEGRKRSLDRDIFGMMQEYIKRSDDSFDTADFDYYATETEVKRLYKMFKAINEIGTAISVRAFTAPT